MEPTEIKVVETKSDAYVDDLIVVSRNLCINVKESLHEFQSLRRTLIACTSIVIVACTIMVAVSSWFTSNQLDHALSASVGNQNKLPDRINLEIRNAIKEGLLVCQ